MTNTRGIPEYVTGNREAWQRFAAEYVEPAERNWAGEPSWGIWGLPESELELLPADLSGQRCVELGCGAGYVSAWLARRGGEPIGIDPTPNQLATARGMMKRFGGAYPLVEGIAECLPFVDDAFDFAISEYGAALWADPYRWIPEAARVLKPGGQLVFLTNAALCVLCVPDDEERPVETRLLRPYLGMHRTEWADSPGQTEFHLPHGEWIALLRNSGFEIERLLELGAPPGATTRYPWADAEWARSWPTEEAWVARLLR